MYLPFVFCFVLFYTGDFGLAKTLKADDLASSVCTYGDCLCFYVFYCKPRLVNWVNKCLDNHIEGSNWKLLHRPRKWIGSFLFWKDDLVIILEKLRYYGNSDIAAIMDLIIFLYFHEQVVGTPNYMCPELLADIPYGFKSDIWSLGMIS